MADNLEDNEIQKSVLSLQPKFHQLSVNQTSTQIKKKEFQNRDFSMTMVWCYF